MVNTNNNNNKNERTGLLDDQKQNSHYVTTTTTTSAHVIDNNIITSSMQNRNKNNDILVGSSSQYTNQQQFDYNNSSPQRKLRDYTKISHHVSPLSLLTTTITPPLAISSPKMINIIYDNNNTTTANNSTTTRCDVVPTTLLSHVESLLSFGGDSECNNNNDFNSSKYYHNASTVDNNDNDDNDNDNNKNVYRTVTDKSRIDIETNLFTNNKNDNMKSTMVLDSSQRTDVNVSDDDDYNYQYDNNNEELVPLSVSTRNLSSSFSNNNHNNNHHHNHHTTNYYNYFSNRPSMNATSAKELWPVFDSNAIFFAIRIACVLTLCGSFVIAPNNQYPQGMWVLISALFVCWFPSMDVGSVVEKCGQRMIGTIIGSIMGVTCGILSLFIVDKEEQHDSYFIYQYIFLSCCLFVGNFLIVFLAGQCKVNNEKVINKFSYATILCVLTFCISLTPFACTISTSTNDNDYQYNTSATTTTVSTSLYKDTEILVSTSSPSPTTHSSYGLILSIQHVYDHHAPQYMPGIIRVGNVLIGCLLGAISSILICPKSTTDVLYEKSARQVRLAGEAADALMDTASEYFSSLYSNKRNNSSTRIIHKPSLSDTILHQQLESTMKWKLRRQNSGCSDDGSVNPLKDHNDETSNINTQNKKSSTSRAQLAVKKYEDAIMDWRATKALFPLAMYDPFASYELKRNSRNTTTRANMIQTDIAQALARSLRIQTTIVVMDGMVRNDTEYDFTIEHTILFSQIGVLIRRMLTVPLNISQTNRAASELFTKLAQIRQCILYVSAHVAAGTDDTTCTGGGMFYDGHSKSGIQSFKDSILSNEIDNIFDNTTSTTTNNNNNNNNDKTGSNSCKSMNTDDDEGRGILKSATSKYYNTLFFLQLVEHLILRSLRLYQAWKHVEIKASL